MVAITPGEAAVMKRSAKAGAPTVGVPRGSRRTPGRPAPRSAYSTSRDGLRRVADAGRVAPAAGQHLREVGEVDQVAGEQAAARAAEAAHAAGHVGREAGARLLAVVADVDADLELPGHHVGDRGVGLARERGRVDRLAPVAADEQVAQRGRPRKAAHVGGEDAPVAALHASRPWE